MQLYDPTVERLQQNFNRASALTNLEGKIIGVLENGKLNAVSMLQETATLFERRHGCTVLPIFSKSNASAPAPKETLQTAAQNVDFLITGLGD